MSLEIDNIPDVSQWQGDIDWSQVPAPIAIIKVSDGAGYFDPQATKNYYGAKAAGKAIGMYHFAEWGDATAEAQEFVRAVDPLEESDVLILDVEAIKVADPVNWVQTWVNYVHDQTTTWPLVYMNLSTLNAYNWSPILHTCGLWLADWAVSPHDNIPTNHTYVMQQYSDSGTVAGIQGRVDLDAWFGSVEQFKAYGYNTSQPTSTPAPDPAPAPSPEPSPSPVPETPPVVEPSPTPVVQPGQPTPAGSGQTPEPVPVITGPAPAPHPASSDALKNALLALFAAIGLGIVALTAWLHS